jgi:hypothetical protein
MMRQVEPPTESALPGDSPDDVRSRLASGARQGLVPDCAGGRPATAATEHPNWHRYLPA